MSTNTEQLRRNIEQTRAELGEDVDALAEKVTPSKIMDRQSRKVRNAFGTAKEKVMGVVSDTQDAVGDLAQTSGELPRNAVQSAKGNPLAIASVKETAAESATNVRDEVGSAAGRVKGSGSSRGKGTRASDASI